MKLTREMRERVEMVQSLGIEVLEISWNGKHPKLLVRKGDKTMKLTMAATSSDHRGNLNWKSFVRRQFAQVA